MSGRAMNTTIDQIIIRLARFACSLFSLGSSIAIYTYQPSRRPLSVKSQTVPFRNTSDNLLSFQPSPSARHVFQTITIVAPGLLGASLAMAAHQRGLAKSIHLCARRQEVVDALAEKPWCQLASTDLAETVRDADLVVLCAPVNRIISFAKELAPIVERNPIVTDVGSVKGDIVRHCEANLAGKARFIGSHPMAGSEKTGMENAEAELFEGRSCFVTPSEKSDPDALSQTVEFWTALGSTVIEETPDKHDEIVANVSHLPHVVASSLASFLAERCSQSADYCGNGLRDTTRIASGSPELWREIFSQNRHEVLRSIRDFQDHLQSLAATLANENDLELLKHLADAKAFRDQL